MTGLTEYLKALALLGAACMAAVALMFVMTYGPILVRCSRGAI